MAAPLDHDILSHKLTLFLRRKLSASARELLTHLDISQPTLHRVVKGTEGVHKIGKARAARYVITRAIEGVSTPISVYQISPDGTEEFVGVLLPVASEGFCFQGQGAWPELVRSDLPYFLDDMRPRGFLGQLIPALYPDLNLTRRAEDWSNSEVLRYLTHYGTNAVGNFIIGQDALRAARREREQLTLMHHDVHDYPQLVKRQLEGFAGGSSIGGDQPKFIAIRKGMQFIVKYSPPLNHEIGRRWGDLLIAEFHAAEILRTLGVQTVSSQIQKIDNQIFLETKRFDRTDSGGRTGVLSLSALDAEFLGMLPATWIDLAQQLLHLKHLPCLSIVQKIKRISLFGQLIGNTDMHAGNLSFLHKDLKITDLAPVYDMTCMLYAPVANQLVERELRIEEPLPEDRPLWDVVAEAAMAFWERVASDERVSDAFRFEAGRNRGEVLGMVK